MDYFNNSSACMGWLKYLYEKCGADKLFSAENIVIDDALALMDIHEFMLIFGAEVQLAGARGVDVSAEYPIFLFDGKNPFAGTQLSPTGEFLEWYARLLKAFNPDLMHHCNAYLEADTSKGRVERVGCFLGLRGEASQKLGPQVLERKGQGNRSECLQRILEATRENYGLWYLGFMDSRQENPLRITLHRNSGSSSDSLIADARKIIGRYFTDQMAAQLKQVAAFGMRDVFLSFDIMPDGQIGKNVGVELFIGSARPTRQRLFMGQENYKSLVKWFKDEGLADERIDLLSDCLWSRLVTDDIQEPYYTYSAISHFKLAWKDGKPKPAKVYLQLTPCPYQIDINTSIAMTNGR